MKNNFLTYIHNFRGFAILLIVGVHCRTSLQWPEKSLPHDLLTFGLDSSTILFVFISGFLFQYLNPKEFNYWAYLTKKIKYVLIPYILVSIPAIADKLLFETDAYWMSPFYKSLPVPFQIIYMLATGKHSGPFYFIPMITIIFFLSIILFEIQKSKYFTLVTVLLVSIALYTFAYGYYGTIGESLLYFLPVYVFGMWVSQNREGILALNKYVLLVLIASYLSIFYLEIIGKLKSEHLQFFEQYPNYFTSHFNWSKLKEMILAILLLIMFYRIRKINLYYLELLGSFSFGIYFLHIYFINLTEHILNYLHVSRLQNGIGYFVFTFGVVIASALTVYLIKKIFSKRSRFLIGS